MNPEASVERVLIYRLGSLGDTVIALPCFHLVARVYPNVERRVLTNFSISQKAAALSEILGDSGLIHGYFEYPVGLRDARRLLALRAEIARWKPDVLVYMIPHRGMVNAFRDAIFFRACGIRKLVGVPYTKALQSNIGPDQFGLFEYEAARLARTLAPLGDANLNSAASWDLNLTDEEAGLAKKILSGWSAKPFVACSLGTKVDVKDWGLRNWEQLIQQLGQEHPDYGLLWIGAGDELEQCDIVSKNWPGLTINLCGKLTPRQSAAILEHAAIFIGHDSGPMHLAASVGIPCVAIFSARDKPGIWFPYGAHHKVIYHKTECYGCKLSTCAKYQKKCIASIMVEEVKGAATELLRDKAKNYGRGNLNSRII